MLFTDNTVSTIEDLAAYETSITETAASEGIDLTRKLGLATTEIGIDLAVRLEDLPIGNVVVTEALRIWHTFHTLALVYRDAYNQQLNDRYRGKWQQYRKLAKSAADRLFLQGVGMVYDPIARAEPVQLTQVAFPAAAAVYYASAAWVNRSGEAGAPGTPATLATEDGYTLAVAPVDPPANAFGWNVYVGYSSEAMHRQNTTPLALDQGWSLLQTAPANGPEPGEGQAPNYYHPLARVLLRG